LGKRIKDGDKAVDGIKRERGYGSDVSCAEEGRLEKGEEKEGGTQIGERQRPERGGGDGWWQSDAFLESCRDGRERVLVNGVFETNPGYEGYAEAEIEYPFE